MKSWKGADPALAQEAEERDLFRRRARARAPGEVPSLASVLRAARQRRDVTDGIGIERWRGPAARGAQVRTLVAMTLAAACMTAAVTRLPRTQTEPAIAAEANSASTPRTPVSETAVRVPSAGDTTRQASSTASTSGSTCTASDDALFPEEETCVPPSVFASTPSVTAMVPIASPPSVTAMVSVAPQTALLASLAPPPVSLACEESE